MKRARQLGTIVFGLNSLFVKEEQEGSMVQSEVKMSAAGTHVVYEKEILTPYLTLDSGQYGWITDDQRAELLAIWNDPGGTLTLTYDDGSTETVRMAREKQISFTPLFEGSDHFTATIPLAKI